MGVERRAGSRLIAIVAVAALAVVVLVLAVIALQRANPDQEVRDAAPVPTFTLGVQTETPTPTPTPEQPVTTGRENERFLSQGSGALWRATGGLCGAAEPLVERSTDDGATWSDVTARYLGLRQVLSLDAFADTEAEMVGVVGEACETQALRTFTQGRFWESYPEVLAASRYLAAGDRASVMTPSGPLAAPCAAASGVRTSGETLVLVCDGAAWSTTGADWTPLAAESAVAVAVLGSDVLVAHASAECAGTAITRFVDGSAATDVGCAEGTNAASPAALAVTDGAVLLWSGDALVRIES